MAQKLSAMRYIKNNKRRVAVLMVSLGLCFVLAYLTGFLLSTTEETFGSIVLENTQKIQYISLAGSSLGIDVDHVSDEEFAVLYGQKTEELIGKLKQQEGVSEAWYVPVIYEEIIAAVGNMTVEMPLVSREQIGTVLTHFGAELAEGRLAENPGEVVLDVASMENNGYEIGSYMNEDYYGKTYRIVGILDCGQYFGCGIPAEGWNQNQMIAVLSEGIGDMSSVLAGMGITVRDNYDNVVDYQWGKTFLKEEVVDVIANSTTFIFVGILVVLAISLTVVYIAYLRDRHSEWCLYSSIGFSRREIYFSIFRELLFTFAVALAVGAVLIVLLMLALNAAMIEPLGLKCSFFLPGDLGRIVCSYVLLFGILQIPVRYALYRIRTVDAMDDDLY